MEDSADGSSRAPLFPHAAFDVVVIAASLGGRIALERLLAPLPADFPAPILAVQHGTASAPSYLAELLDRRLRLRCTGARDGETVQAGSVYIAPAGRHLPVTADGRCELTDGERVSFARPAGDLLFASAAESFGARTLALILTGRLFDGTAGALKVRSAGGMVLAQDPATCEAPDMPRSAIRAGAVQLVLPLEALTAALVRLVGPAAVPTALGHPVVAA